MACILYIILYTYIYYSQVKQAFLNYYEYDNKQNFMNK